MEQLNEVCIVGDADNTNNYPLAESDAIMRLQQAAHILVTGAIRAAQKAKTRVKKPSDNPTRSAELPMSEFPTSGEISCKTSRKLSVNATCKSAHSNSFSEGTEAKGR